MRSPINSPAKNRNRFTGAEQFLNGCKILSIPVCPIIRRTAAESNSRKPMTKNHPAIPDCVADISKVIPSKARMNTAAIQVCFFSAILDIALKSCCGKISPKIDRAVTTPASVHPVIAAIEMIKLSVMGFIRRSRNGLSAYHTTQCLQCPGETS